MRLEGTSGEHIEVWDTQADVIIVGAGDAGLAAAIEAVDAGANTIVFEKMGSTRSTSSAMSGGVISFAWTDFQQRQGVQDSNDLFLRDIMDAGGWKNCQTLVKVFIEKQLDTYYWLTALGVKWFRLVAAGGMSVPRGHVTDPVEHVRALEDAARKKGAQILFRTRVTELLTDKDKRVIGVSAESAGQALRVKARKGVVLATGGFGRDTKRLGAIDPRLAEIKVVVGPGHTGDGHRMAETLGACFRHMEPEYLKPTIGRHVSGSRNKTSLLAFWSGAILVNKTGNRFVDESLESRSLGKASLRQPEHIVYEIFDQRVFDREQRARASLNEAIAGLLIRAQTIQELASKTEIPPQTLKETVDRYNYGVDTGKDPDFGRTSLVHGVGAMTRIDAPPFYAYETEPRLPGTYAGVAVDESMHVLTTDGIIPGLYGAGELVGGFHGTGYHVGTALAKALVFGRIAGRNITTGR